MKDSVIIKELFHKYNSNKILFYFILFKAKINFQNDSIIKFTYRKP